MAKPNTRQKLIDYCLRSLGHPVIEINIDEDQLEDRIDEAIQYYQEYDGDAVVRNLRKHKVTNSSLVSTTISARLRSVLLGTPPRTTRGFTVLSPAPSCAASATTKMSVVAVRIPRWQ